MTQYIFTQRGYKLLTELIEKTRKQLSQITNEKAKAGSGQDTWHDEGFKIAVAEEMMWSKRLGELQSLIFNARVTKPKEQNEFVEIGTGIIIEYEDGSTFRFILDGYLVDITEDYVSIYSPLGKALLGARKGEERKLEKTEKIVKVKKIFPPSKAKSVLQEE